jgi:hypothetical protein
MAVPAVDPSLPAGSQDSEWTLSVAVAADGSTLVEQPTVESVRTEEVMTVVEYPAASAARVSEMALVVALTSSPPSSLVGRFVDDHRLVDEVV